jgi:lysophospholipase L1-like esterase
MEKPNRRSKIWGNLLALVFGIFVSLILAEIVLRIFHPIPYRIKHGRIVLPANQKIVHKNPGSKKLEHTIHYSRNSLGMRGEEIPKDTRHWVRIITIGGSTTECAYNSDSLTWPEVLKRKLREKINPLIWVNNAGLDGTSTYGHIMLLKDYILPLNPDYIIFLTGVNDVENEAKDDFDLYHSNEINKSSAKEFFRSLLKKTELGGLLENFYRYRLAYNKGLIHREIDYKKEPTMLLDAAAVNAQLAKQTPFLAAYKNRILILDSICRANNIKAIFLTQPSLYAAFTDPATGIDFANLKVSEERNAVTEGKVLQLYNNILRDLKTEGRIETIDMANAMPLNSSLYYDFTHYTSLGTVKFGNILYDSLAVKVK